MNHSQLKLSVSLVILTALLCGCSVLAPRPTPTQVPTDTQVPPTFTPIPPTLTFTSTPLPPTPTITLTPWSQVDAANLVDISSLCRQNVDGIKSLHQGIPASSYYLDDDIQSAAASFDVNRYFSVLDHVSLETGYYLDHLYFIDDIGAKPMLYAEKRGSGPFLRYEEYVEYLGEELQWERSYQTLYYAYDYLGHIEIDESSEAGYFQFILLALLGDQFHLFWHGLYHDAIIICDETDLDRISADILDFDIELDPDLIADAQTLDLTPTVGITEDTVEIRFIQFSKWGGFSESIYILERNAPYRLIDVIWNTLIEYNCGVTF